MRRRSCLSGCIGRSGSFGIQAAFHPGFTVNVCHDMNRKRLRRAEVDLVAAIRVTAVPAGDAGQDTERQMAAIRAGLQQLGEKERAAIVLRDIEGLPTPEVAAILGSSEATVRSQISVGRRKIRKFAEAYMRRRS
jgi:RNA polymerase sigma-70 factor (ECF subfamily)